MQGQTYEVERTSGRCVKTQRKLEPGEKYVACLVDAAVYSAAEIQKMKGKTPKKGEELKPASRSADGVGLWRLDVSQQAWDEDYRPEGLFSFWQAEVHHPNQKKKMFVNNEVMMDIIRGLEDTADRNRLAFRFVVSLILFRKKLLRYERTEQHPAPVAPEVQAELADTPEDSPEDSPEGTPEDKQGTPNASPDSQDEGWEAVDSEEMSEAPSTDNTEQVKDTALCNWWVFTPKLDINKGHMGKWHPDETLMVMDPDLDESGIEAITEQLSDILASELE